MYFVESLQLLHSGAYGGKYRLRISTDSEQYDHLDTESFLEASENRSDMFIEYLDIHRKKPLNTQA
jgi:hypothetical protein